PMPARHMTDVRRAGDQDFDFFPRRRSASNSRPPPASTKALIPAPTAISGTLPATALGEAVLGSSLAYAKAASTMLARAASPMSRKAITDPRLTAQKPDIGVSTWCLLSIVVPSA